MKLTVGQSHSLYLAIATIERDAEHYKLAAEVWLKLAINSNALRPIAEGYERGRQRTLADLYRANRDMKPEERRHEAEIQADMLEKDDAERVKEIDVPQLKTFLQPELRVSDNPKIGSVISRLLPIIDDAK